MPASRTPPASGAADRAPLSSLGARSSPACLLGALARDPALLPCVAALAVLIAWAIDDGGYPQTVWAPGGLILLALLAIAIGARGLRAVETPLAVRLAIACLAGYTALSFLSILWAKVPGDAWEGADRTLVYLVIFCLFATWRRSAGLAAVLLGAWALAMVGLAVFTVLHINAAAGSPARLQSLIGGGRLTFPAGYQNANAALWMIPCFSAFVLSSAKQIPWAVRGLLAGGAVVLADLALYSQSRGSVYSIPIVLALVFLLLPRRARMFATLLPIAAGAAAAAPAVLRLCERLESGSATPATVHSATLSVLLAGAIVTAVVAVAAALEVRLPVSTIAVRRGHRFVAGVGILALLGIVAFGSIAVGNPVARAKREWRTFTSVHGYGADREGGSRLTGGLGSNRYDFYRVAWREFVAHPAVGTGADNYAESYLRLGRSDETPHYPHSVELSTLTETGAVGALLALVGLAAALLASWRRLRSADRLGSTVVAAALAGFGYWVIHGSFDWFFEYAGLGGAAFALLGIACSLSSRARAPQPAFSTEDPSTEDSAALDSSTQASSTDDSPTQGSPAQDSSARKARFASGRLAGAAVLAGALLAAGVSLATPWLSRLYVQQAGEIWTLAPAKAYSRLQTAGQLNPLSDEANLVAGSIALRLGEYRRADRQFGLALRRSPDDAYATLERGAIASSLGRRAQARGLLERASKLDPRDPLARGALKVVRDGGRVDIAALNRSILREARQF